MHEVFANVGHKTGKADPSCLRPRNGSFSVAYMYEGGALTIHRVIQRVMRSTAQVEQKVGQNGRKSGQLSVTLAVTDNACVRVSKILGSHALILVYQVRTFHAHVHLLSTHIGEDTNDLNDID